MSAGRDLQARSKQLAERLSESIHILDHDPSMALYRLQEHVNKTLPVLVNRKLETMKQNGQLQGACFDLDNALRTLDQMRATIPVFEGVHERLRDCLHLKQQLDYENARSSKNSTRAEEKEP